LGSLAPFLHSPLQYQLDLTVQAAEILLCPPVKLVPQILVYAQQVTFTLAFQISAPS
jgi:hypothetical protein